MSNNLFQQARASKQREIQSYGPTPYQGQTPQLTFDNFERSKYTPYVSGSFSPYTYDLDEIRARNQGFLQKAWRGTERFVGSTGLKFLEGVGYLGGLAGWGNTSTEDGWGWIAGAADNGLAKWASNSEKWLKEEWAPLYNEKKDKEKSPFARMFTDADFWFDEAVDGAAFMASAWIPGGILSKVGKGVSLGRFIAQNGSKFLRAAEVGKKAAWMPQLGMKTEKAIDLVAQTAFMTSTEAMFEAKEVRDNVYEKLVNKINPKTGQYYTDSEAKKIASQSASDTFKMNVAALALSNFLEAKMIIGLGKGSRTSRGINIDPKRAMVGGELAAEKTYSNVLSKFWNSRTAAVAGGFASGIAREGLYEENIQHAIQQVNESFGAHAIEASFKDKLSLVAGDVLPGANSYKEKERQTNILLGSILGGGMSAYTESRQFTADKKFRENAIQGINKSYSNYRNADLYEMTDPKEIEVYKKGEGAAVSYHKKTNGKEEAIDEMEFNLINDRNNLTKSNEDGSVTRNGGKFTIPSEYVLDANGNRVINPAKKASYLAQFENGNELDMVISALEKDNTEKAKVASRVLRNKQFDQFALQMIAAGETSALEDLLDRFSEANETDAEHFAIDNPSEYKKNISKLKERVKRLEEIHNTVDYQTNTEHKDQGLRKLYLTTLAADLMSLEEEVKEAKKQVPVLANIDVLEVERENTKKAKRFYDRNKRLEKLGKLGDALKSAVNEVDNMANAKSDSWQKKEAELVSQGYVNDKGEFVDKYEEALRKSPEGLKYKLKAAIAQELENSLQSVQKEWNKVIDPVSGLRYYRNKVKKALHRRGANILINASTTPESYKEYEESLLRSKYLQFLYDNSIREHSEIEVSKELAAIKDVLKNPKATEEDISKAVQSLRNLGKSVLDSKYGMRIEPSTHEEIVDMLSLLNLLTNDSYLSELDDSIREGGNTPERAVAEVLDQHDEFDKIQQLLNKDSNLINVIINHAKLSDSSFPNYSNEAKLVNDLENNKDALTTSLKADNQTLHLRREIANDLQNKSNAAMQKASTPDNYDNALLKELREAVEFLKNLKRVFEERNKTKETLDGEKVKILETAEFQDFVPSLDTKIKQLEDKAKEVNEVIQDRNKADEMYDKAYKSIFFSLFGISVGNTTNTVVKEAMKEMEALLKTVAAELGTTVEEITSLSKDNNTIDLLRALGELLKGKGKSADFLVAKVRELKLKIYDKIKKAPGAKPEDLKDRSNTSISGGDPEGYAKNPDKLVFKWLGNQGHITAIKYVKEKGGALYDFLKDGNVTKLLFRLDKHIEEAKDDAEKAALTNLKNNVELHAYYSILNKLESDYSGDSIISSLLKERNTLLEQKKNLADGKDVLPSPTRQQRIVLQQIANWFGNDSQLFGFLNGAAGTGKTNLLTRLFLAVSGINSNQVLTAGRDKDTHAKTIAESLKTSINTTDDIIKLLEDDDASLKNIKLIVLDEVGIEDTAKINKLVELLNKRVADKKNAIKLLALGDPNQLSLTKRNGKLVFETVPKIIAATTPFSQAMRFFDQLTIVFRTNVGAITSFANLFKDNDNNVLDSELFVESTSDVVSASAMFGVNGTIDFKGDIVKLAAVNPERSKAIITNQNSKAAYVNFLSTAGINNVKVYTYDECTGLTIDEIYVDIVLNEEFGDVSVAGYSPYNSAMYQALTRATKYVLVNNLNAKVIVTPELASADKKAKADFSTRQVEHEEEINDSLRALKPFTSRFSDVLTKGTSKASKPATEAKTKPEAKPAKPDDKSKKPDGTTAKSDGETTPEFIKRMETVLNNIVNLNDLEKVLNSDLEDVKAYFLIVKDSDKFKSFVEKIRKILIQDVTDATTISRKHTLSKIMAPMFYMVDTEKESAANFNKETFDLQGKPKPFLGRLNVEFFVRNKGNEVDFNSLNTLESMLNGRRITPTNVFEFLLEYDMLEYGNPVLDTLLSAIKYKLDSYKEYTDRIRGDKTTPMSKKFNIPIDKLNSSPHKKLINSLVERVKKLAGTGVNKLTDLIQSIDTGTTSKFARFDAPSTNQDFLDDLAVIESNSPISLVDFIGRYELKDNPDLERLMIALNHISKYRNLNVYLYQGDMNALKSAAKSTGGFFYHDKPDNIYIMPGALWSYENVARVVLHEAVHAVFDNLLHTDVDFLNQVIEWRNQLIDSGKISDKDYIFQTLTSKLKTVANPSVLESNEMTAVKEFLVAALTDPDVKKALQEIPAGNKSLWDVISDFIKSLFDIKNDTLYHEVFLTSLNKAYEADRNEKKLESEIAHFARINAARMFDENLDTLAQEFINEFDPTIKTEVPVEIPTPEVVELVRNEKSTETPAETNEDISTIQAEINELVKKLDALRNQDTSETEAEIVELYNILNEAVNKELENQKAIETAASRTTGTDTVVKSIDSVIDENVSENELKELIKEEGLNTEEEAKQKIKEEVIVQINDKDNKAPQTLLQRLANKIKNILLTIAITATFISSVSFSFAPSAKSLTYDNAVIENLQSFEDVIFDQDSLNKLENVTIITEFNKDSNDKYIIVDKSTGVAHLYQGNSLITSYQVGIGEREGDEQTRLHSIFFNSKGKEVSANEAVYVENGNSYLKPGYSSKTNWNKGNKKTGAGIYTISRKGKYGGGKAFYLKNERGQSVATALHKAVNVVRANKLNDKNPENNRFSNGCLNFNLNDLNNIDNQGIGKDSKVYILPDNPNNKFKIIDGKLTFTSQNKNVNRTPVRYEPQKITVKAEKANETGKDFLQSLSDNKAKIMYLYPTISNDEYNQVISIAYGIFGQESSFGTYGGLRGQSGRITDMAQLVANSLLGKEYNPSVGVTQIRFSNIRNEIREVFNINNISDLLNTEKAAVATMAHLLDIYVNEIPFNLKEQFKELLPLAYSNHSEFVKYKKTKDSSVLNNKYVENIKETASTVSVYLGINQSPLSVSFSDIGNISSFPTEENMTQLKTKINTISEEELKQNFLTSYEKLKGAIDAYNTGLENIKNAEKYVEGELKKFKDKLQKLLNSKTTPEEPVQEPVIEEEKYETLSEDMYAYLQPGDIIVIDKTQAEVISNSKQGLKYKIGSTTRTLKNQPVRVSLGLLNELELRAAERLQTNEDEVDTSVEKEFKDYSDNYEDNIDEDDDSQYDDSNGEVEVIEGTHALSYPNNNSLDIYTSSSETIDSVKEGDTVYFVAVTYPMEVDGQTINVAGVKVVAQAYTIDENGNRTEKENHYLEIGVETDLDNSPFSGELMNRYAIDLEHPTTTFTPTSTGHMFFSREGINRDSIVAKGTFNGKSNKLKVVYGNDYVGLNIKVIRDILTKIVRRFMLVNDEDVDDRVNSIMRSEDNTSYAIQVYTKKTAAAINEKHYGGKNHIKPGMPYLVVFNPKRDNSSMSEAKPIYIKMSPRRMKSNDLTFQTMTDFIAKVEKLKEKLATIIPDTQILDWFINESETFGELLKSVLDGNTYTIKKRKFAFYTKGENKTAVRLANHMFNEITKAFPEAQGYGFLTDLNYEFANSIVSQLVEVAKDIYAAKKVLVKNTQKNPNAVKKVMEARGQEYNGEEEYEVTKLSPQGPAQLAFNVIAVPNLIAYLDDTIPISLAEKGTGKKNRVYRKGKTLLLNRKSVTNNIEADPVTNSIVKRLEKKFIKQGMDPTEAAEKAEFLSGEAQAGSLNLKNLQALFEVDSEGNSVTKNGFGLRLPLAAGVFKNLPHSALENSQSLNEEDLESNFVNIKPTNVIINPVIQEEVEEEEITFGTVESDDDIVSFSDIGKIEVEGVDKEVFMTRIKQILPGIRPNEIKYVSALEMHRLTSGKSSFGTFIDGIIYLTESQDNQIYLQAALHEVFHKIWNNYLSPREKKAILRDLMKKYPHTQTMNMAEAEEYLADMWFINYKFDIKTSHTTLLDRFIKWLSGLFRFVHKSYDSLDTLFNDLNSAKFNRWPKYDFLGQKNIAKVYETFGEPQIYLKAKEMVVEALGDLMRGSFKVIIPVSGTKKNGEEVTVKFEFELNAVNAYYEVHYTEKARPLYFGNSPEEKLKLLKFMFAASTRNKDNKLTIGTNKTDDTTSKKSLSDYKDFIANLYNTEVRRLEKEITVLLKEPVKNSEKINELNKEINDVLNTAINAISKNSLRNVLVKKLDNPVIKQAPQTFIEAINNVGIVLKRYEAMLKSINADNPGSPRHLDYLAISKLVELKKNNSETLIKNIVNSYDSEEISSTYDYNQTVVDIVGKPVTDNSGEFNRINLFNNLKPGYTTNYKLPIKRRVNDVDTDMTNIDLFNIVTEYFNKTGVISKQDIETLFDVINSYDYHDLSFAKRASTKTKATVLMYMSLGVPMYYMNSIVHNAVNYAPEDNIKRTGLIKSIDRSKLSEENITNLKNFFESISVAELTAIIDSINKDLSNVPQHKQVEKEIKLKSINFPILREIIKDIYPVVAKASVRKNSQDDEDITQLYENQLASNAELVGILEYTLDPDQVNHYSKLSRSVKDSLSTVFYKKPGSDSKILIPPTTVFAKTMALLEGVTFDTVNVAAVQSAIRNNAGNSLADKAVVDHLFTIISKATTPHPVYFKYTEGDQKQVLLAKFEGEDKFVIITPARPLSPADMQALYRMTPTELKILQEKKEISYVEISRDQDTTSAFLQRIVDSNLISGLDLLPKLVASYEKSLYTNVLAETYSSIGSLRSKNLYKGLRIDSPLIKFQEDDDIDPEDSLAYRKAKEYEYTKLSTWGDEMVARSSVKNVIEGKLETLAGLTSLDIEKEVRSADTLEKQNRLIKDFFIDIGLITEGEYTNVTNAAAVVDAIYYTVTEYEKLVNDIKAIKNTDDEGNIVDILEQKNNLINRFYKDRGSDLGLIRNVKIIQMSSQKSNNYTDGKGKRRWKKQLSDNVYDLINAMELGVSLPEFIKSRLFEHNVFNTTNKKGFKLSIYGYVDHDSQSDEGSDREALEYVDEKARDYHERVFFQQFLNFLTLNGSITNTNNPLKYIQNFYINSNKKEARAAIVKVLNSKHSYRIRKALRSSGKSNFTASELLDLAQSLGINIVNTSKETNVIDFNFLKLSFSAEENETIVEFSNIREYAKSYVIGAMNLNTEKDAAFIEKFKEANSSNLKSLLNDAEYGKHITGLYLQGVINGLSILAKQNESFAKYMYSLGLSKIEYNDGNVNNKSIGKNIQERVLGNIGKTKEDFIIEQLESEANKSKVDKYFNPSTDYDIEKNFGEIGLAIVEMLKIEASRVDPDAKDTNGNYINKIFRVKNYVKNWKKSYIAGMDKVMTMQELDNPALLYEAVSKVYEQLENKANDYFNLLFRDLTVNVHNDFIKKALKRLIDAGLINSTDPVFKILPSFSRIKKMKENGTWDSFIDTYKDQFMPLVRAFYLNNYVNSFHLNHLAIGDKAFYNGAYDIIKRMSIFFATGTKGLVSNFLDVLPKTYNVAVLQDLKTTVGEEKWNEFEQLTGKDFEAWDGAGFMLPEWYEKLNKGFGNAMKLGITMKPVYGGKDANGIPRAVKYSQIVLTDELCNAFPGLKDLRKQMREKGAQEAVFSSAFKVGTPLALSPLKEREKDGRKVFGHEIIKDSIVTLQTSLYRIQENPEKSADYSVSNPTQLMYFVDTMGNNIEEQSLMMKLVSKLMQANHNVLTMDLSVGSDMEQIKAFKDKIAKTLADVAGSERQHELLTSQSRNAKGIPVTNVDINMPMLVTKVITQFASLITKKAVSIKFTGGAYVLQPDYGSSTSVLEVYKDDVLVDVLTTYSNHGYKAEQGYTFKTRGLEFNTKQGYAEVIVSQSYAEALGLKVGDYMYAPKKEEKEMYEMLGFRIPSTWLHSALPIKVVGFYPSSRDTNIIIAPQELVLIHGSDYDIDKLYVIKKELYTEPMSIKFNNEEIVVGEDKEIIEDIETEYGLLSNVLEWALQDLHEQYRDLASQKSAAKAQDKAVINAKLRIVTQDIEKYTEFYGKLMKNKILNIYLQVTTDPKNRKIMYSPISVHRFNGKLSKEEKDAGVENTAVGIIESLTGRSYKPDRDLDDVTQNQKMHEDNTTGMNVTGMAANGVKGIRYATMAVKEVDPNDMPEVKDSLAVTIGGTKYQKFQTKEKVTNDTGQIVDNEVIIGLDKNGKPIKHVYTVWETLDSIINAAIDNVKEQILYHVNITNNTIKTWVVATALGVPMPLNLKLHLQPSVLEISKQTSANSNKILAKLIEKLQVEHKIKLEKDLADKLNEKDITEEMLNKNLYKEDFFLNKQSADDILDQIAIMLSYRKLHETSKGLKKVQDTVTPLTGGTPYTYELMEKYLHSFSSMFTPEKESKVEEDEETDEEVDELIKETEDKNLSETADKVWESMTPVPMNKISPRFPFKNVDVRNVPVLSSLYSFIQEATFRLNSIFLLHNKAVIGISKVIYTRLNSLGIRFKLGDNKYETQANIRKQYIRYILQGYKHYNMSNQKSVFYNNKMYYSIDAWNIEFIENLKQAQKTNPTNIFLSSLEFEKDKKSGLPIIRYTTFGQLQDVDLWSYSKAFDELKHISSYPGNLEWKAKKWDYSILQQHLLQYAVMNWGVDFGSSNYTLLMPPKIFKPISSYLKSYIKSFKKEGQTEEEVMKSIVKSDDFNHFLMQLVNNNADEISGTEYFRKNKLISWPKDTKKYDIVTGINENGNIVQTVYADAVIISQVEDKNDPDKVRKFFKLDAVDSFIVLNNGGTNEFYIVTGKDVVERKVYLMRIKPVKKSAAYYENNEADKSIAYTLNGFKEVSDHYIGIPNIAELSPNETTAEITITSSEKMESSLIGKTITVYDSNDITRKKSYQAEVSGILESSAEERNKIIKEIDATKKKRNYDKKELDRLFNNLSKTFTKISLINVRPLYKTVGAVDTETNTDLTETEQAQIAAATNDITQC